MNRRERQARILEIVGESAVSTQAELAAALRADGFDVVQTTVSRDIQELGLAKVRAPSGRLVYAAPGTSDADRMKAIAAAMRRYAVAIEATASLVVVTTPSGYASALAQALDEGRHPRIAGTLAGDNTIFVAPRADVSPADLRDELGDSVPAPSASAAPS
jgi:transcriptional regulator of arginine metabolism